MLVQTEAYLRRESVRINGLKRCPQLADLCERLLCMRCFVIVAQMHLIIAPVHPLKVESFCL